MKKIIIPIFIFACMLSFAGCMVNSVSFDIEEAAMIRLCSGADRTMVEITDQDDIGRITENINVLKFEKGYSSKTMTDGATRLPGAIRTASRWKRSQ